MKKNVVAGIILSVVFVGAFLVRTYHFKEWLYFKMDQSRDAMLVSNAVKYGVGHLPLLGPRSGATEVDHGYLRLGPIFYYFQFFSGKLFNSIEPQVFAYPDLFFSMMAILMLYALVRLYFSRFNSLLIVIMYSFSFLVIQYSRFAWNPNSLPFFMFLGFYGLLKFFRETVATRKKWWLAASAFGLAVGSQLHFFGFFSLVGIAGIMVGINYQLWKKDLLVKIFKKETLLQIVKFSFVIMAVFGILYAPVIISDIKKGGENAKNFVQALASKPKDKPFLDKVFQNTERQLKYYCIITTSNCYSGGVKDDVSSSLATAAVLFAGIGSAIWILRKKKDHRHKDFVWLILVWIGVFFILSIPVSFQLRPRFFIVVFPIPFILLGFFFEWLEKMLKKNGRAVAIIITGIILFFNFQGTRAWFQEQDKSQSKNFTVKRTLILKNKDGVTLKELQGAADYIYSHRKAGVTAYYYVKPEHVMPIKYLLYLKNDPNFKYAPISINKDPNAQYFAITPTKNEIQPVKDKYGDQIDLISSEKFGQIMVSEINFRDREISETFRFNKESKPTDRLFWKDVFGWDTENGAVRIDAAE